MTPLPRTVKIGYLNYTIVEFPHLEAVGADRHGEICHSAMLVKIDLTYGPVRAAETLLHEIMHGICVVWCRADSDPEERTVGILANGLATVWRDNPDVMAWIDEAMAG